MADLNPNGACIKCRLKRKIVNLGLCRSCFRKEHNRHPNSFVCFEEQEFPENNKRRYERISHQRRNLGTCNLLKQHHEDMKDDPESLSTEFLKGILKVECEV